MLRSGPGSQDPGGGPGARSQILDSGSGQGLSGSAWLSQVLMGFIAAVLFI